MATEKMDLAWAEAQLPETESWVRKVMGRLGRLAPFARSAPLEVLEIGSAQGRALIALSRAGHRASGVEPWAPAIEVARQLAKEHNATLDIREGRCEALPFEGGRFDVVLALSVLEHVSDLEVSLREIARVLKPGGFLYLNSASAMSPFQAEIRFFPLFGWYPDRWKKAIMRWCVTGWPAAINHTQAPALWWWTPGRARQWLGAAGFDRIWDRWELQAASTTGWKGALIRIAVAVPGARCVGDMLVPACDYAARKGF
jgi:SAM-dependent methyltransferase